MMAKRWGRGASALLCITLWAGMAFASAPVAAQDPPADPPAAPDTVWHRITESIDAAFGKLNGYLAGVLFFDMAFGGIETDEVDRDGTPILDAGGNPQKKTVVLPFIVAFLFVGAIVFSFVYKFINIRAFRHAFDVTRGKYTDPNAVGEISHFRALTSALSATVGLGNIAGVAIAIQVGGPGAVFWMWICAVA
jgi:AGCS family alanine or glycine:cation symporter